MCSKIYFDNKDEEIKDCENWQLKIVSVVV